jgi:hypothetical protein
LTVAFFASCEIVIELNVPTGGRLNRLTSWSLLAYILTSG